MKLRDMSPEKREQHIVMALKGYWGYDTDEALAVLGAHEANTLTRVHRQVIDQVFSQEGPYRWERSNVKWREGIVAAMGVLFTWHVELMGRMSLMRGRNEASGQRYEQTLRNSVREQVE